MITHWAARRTHSRADFYAAGARISGTQNGFAIAGDAMSAASFLGLIGLTFEYGYDVLYFIVSLALSWVIVLLFIAERLRHLGTYTFADVVCLRLARGPIRALAAAGTLTVAIPYLIAQLVAAGTLVQQLFGLSYAQGAVLAGLLMTIYVTFGGMIATTWVQIIKAALLLGGGLLLLLLVLQHFDFSLSALGRQAVVAHPRGAALLQPGGMYGTDLITVLSLSLAFIGGTAGLPHVLMRFFTVPDAREARHSAALALSLVCGFQFIVFIVGLGAAALLVGHPDYSPQGTQIIGGSNMVAIHLARELGGEPFMGFIAAVAFATILAVVSGLTLSAAATVSHDLYAQAIRRGTGSDVDELRVSRITAVTLGVTGVGLAILFEGQNVAVLAVLPLAIAASSNFPVLLLAMYWRGLTTRGALAGGYSGMLVSVLLVVLGPSVWAGAFGFEEPLFPYAYPTLFSMPLAFLLAWHVSRSDRSVAAEAERAAFAQQMIRPFSRSPGSGGAAAGN
ncbi:MAG: cation/acetate symporter ActP [Gammaproteobacteria bacterium]|nr:cation/acetate symporter ActP [Gammaproteobacteria bacterium]